MRPTPCTVALAATLLSAGALTAQTTDTLPDDQLRPDDRAEYIERIEDADDYRLEDADTDIEVEEPIAPGEYELREIQESEDVEFEDLDADTTGLQPKRVGDRTEWLMEAEPNPATEPAEATIPKQ